MKVGSISANDHNRKPGMVLPFPPAQGNQIGACLVRSHRQQLFLEKKKNSAVLYGDFNAQDHICVRKMFGNTSFGMQYVTYTKKVSKMTKMLG